MTTTEYKVPTINDKPVAVDLPVLIYGEDLVSEYRRVAQQFVLYVIERKRAAARAEHAYLHEMEEPRNSDSLSAQMNRLAVMNDDSFWEPARKPKPGPRKTTPAVDPRNPDPGLVADTPEKFRPSTPESRARAMGLAVRTQTGQAGMTDARWIKRAQAFEQYVLYGTVPTDN